MPKWCRHYFVMDVSGKFADPDVLPERQVYQPIDDLEGLPVIMSAYLEDFNSLSNTKMDLVLFMNAIEKFAAHIGYLTPI